MGYSPPNKPTKVGTLTNWSSVTGGLSFSFGIKTDGTLWAWGSNEAGRLADGTLISRSSPVQVGALTNWAKIDLKAYHVLAVKTDGTLWSWGDNNVGQLGDGTITNRSSPVQIGAGTGIPLPSLSACLNYFDAYSSEWLPANLIQAQRDLFGSHTFERIDGPGNFHNEWKA